MADLAVMGERGGAPLFLPANTSNSERWAMNLHYVVCLFIILFELS